VRNIRKGSHHKRVSLKRLSETQKKVQGTLAALDKAAGRKHNSGRKKKQEAQDNGLGEGN
jgi:hypothetical protein